MHQSTRRSVLGDPHGVGAGDAARLPTFIGVIGSRSSSPMPRASGSPKNRRFSPLRFRPVSASRSWCRRQRPRARSRSRSENPRSSVWSVREMAQAGVFRTTRRASDGLDAIEQELLALLAARDYEAFMGLAVRSKKNIVVSGATGSGKTTFTKALDPRDPARGAPHHDRGRTGARLERSPESRAALLLQGRSGPSEGRAETAPRELPAHAARIGFCSRSCDPMRRSIICAMPIPGTRARSRACTPRAPSLAFEQLTLLVKQSRKRRRSAATGDQNLAVSIGGYRRAVRRGRSSALHSGGLV